MPGGSSGPRRRLERIPIVVRPNAFITIFVRSPIVSDRFSHAMGRRDRPSGLWTLVEGSGSEKETLLDAPLRSAGRRQVEARHGATPRIERTHAGRARRKRAYRGTVNVAKTKKAGRTSRKSKHPKARLATPFPAPSEQPREPGDWLWIPLRNEWRDETDKPEETVRQRFTLHLRNHYGYAFEQMDQVPDPEVEGARTLDHHRGCRGPTRALSSDSAPPTDDPAARSGDGRRRLRGLDADYGASHWENFGAR